MVDPEGEFMNIKEKPKNNIYLQNENKIDGVVIGLLLGIKENGDLLLAFPGNLIEEAITARSTAQLSMEDIGREVAILFEGGDIHKPLIIGRIQQPSINQNNKTQYRNAELDGETIIFTAEKEIILKCGKASITLTKAGKILINGEYLSSRSTGVNRIKGGSIQLN
jgi:hypothetical protein